MYFLRFRQVALRWDLPERFVAALGIAAVSVAAVLAGVCQQLNEKADVISDLDLHPQGWIRYFSLSVIACTYLVFMAGTAWFIASKPRVGKPMFWLALSAVLTWLLLLVAGNNIIWLFRGTHSIM